MEQKLTPPPIPALSAKDQETLNSKLHWMNERHDFLAGYPCNQHYDYSMLNPALKHSINNIGDPWQSSNYGLNTLDMEREVLTQYAQWLHAPEDNFWGYITTGGTEGNMHALYVARELHPNGIVYYSEDTHYSVTKIIHVLGMQSIMIRSLENGEIDYDDLRETMKLHRDRTPIVFANIGTTMTQAIDSIPTIRKILRDLAITDYYIHSDSAFPGSYLPFLDNPPAFDFAAGAHSISISGHKFIGSPVPCGIVMALKNNIQRIGRRIEYIGALDTTIPGSRNAYTPMVLWTAIKRWGEKGFRELADYCMSNAQYTVDRMQSYGIPAWRNEHGITVIFPRPSEEIIRKWCLAPQRDIVHIITVAHISRDTIDAMLVDILADFRASKRNFLKDKAS